MAEAIDPEAYTVWRESLPLLPASVGKTLASAPGFPAHIINQLMAFPLAASTPVEAMSLVADLQRQCQHQQGSEVADK